MEQVKIEKENAVADYINKVIKRSWTWQRLTSKEKENFNSINFNYIQGTAKQRQYAMMTLYDAFLRGVGYDGWKWRETDETAF